MNYSQGRTTIIKQPVIKPDLPQTLEESHTLIRNLLITIEELFKRVEKLELENKYLRERLNTNSTNSSLPPSRDRKKKRKGKPPSNNRGGGQLGHKGHFRELLALEEVDEVVNCELPDQCLCGGDIILKEDYQRHQVHELPEIKLHVSEYLLAKGYCLHCGQDHLASLPVGVPKGITGPRLTSFMSDLVSSYQLSRRELRGFLAEHFNFKISHGTLFNKQKLVNAVLGKPVLELLESVRESARIHMDETGHNREGKKEWMWGMMTSVVAYFCIIGSRGRKALKTLISDFDGIVISDRYSVYDYFDSSKRQICWAHLKRDFTRLSEKDDRVIARIGKELLACEAALFKIWYAFKQGQITRDELLRKATPIRRSMGDYLEQGSYTDPTLKVARFCKNLLKHFNALWTFLDIEDIEPTNNHAERCLRHSVIWRKKYFCTRSDYGSEFVSRSASIRMTCKLQSKNAFTFVSQALRNHFANLPPPSLVNC